MSISQPKLSLLDPTIAVTPRGALCPRLNTLDGKTIGVLWNGRLEGDVILETIIDLLRRKFALKEVLVRKKPHISNIAPADLFDELIARCDAAIVGVGD